MHHYVRPAGVEVVDIKGLSARELLAHMDDPDFKFPEPRTTGCPVNKDKERRRRLKSSIRKAQVAEEAQTAEASIPLAAKVDRIRVIRPSIVRDAMRERNARADLTPKRPSPLKARPSANAIEERAGEFTHAFLSMENAPVAPEYRKYFDGQIAFATRTASTPNHLFNTDHLSQLEKIVRRLHAIREHTDLELHKITYCHGLYNPFTAIASHFVRRFTQTSAQSA